MLKKISQLHPHSWKHLLKGHPWISKDQYTERFPKQDFIVVSKENNNPSKEDSWFFLHDPKHNNVKGRFWSKSQNFSFEKMMSSPPQQKQFIFSTLEKKLEVAFAKRSDFEAKYQRNHFYLSFYEGDETPGLGLLKAGNTLICFFYAYVWEDLFYDFLKTRPEWLKTHLQDAFQIEHYIFHRRSNQESDRKSPQITILDKSLASLDSLDCESQELGLKFKWHFTRHSYDLGLYPDMSAIRYSLDQTLVNFFEERKTPKIANFFCYTGAFSLWALSKNAQSVHSIDLSEKYLNWLQENLDLNPQLPQENHYLVNTSANQAIKKLLQEKMTFDLIIVDPPTISSDSQRKQTAVDHYKQSLSDYAHLLSPGGFLLVCLNTHDLSRAKCENLFTTLIKEENISLKLFRQFKLHADATPLKGHPEGDYLKVFLWRKA